MAPGEYRLRMCYQKLDRLRYLSHLEVMRALERGARRAGLPYAVTRGFNPHMKMAFGPALPVGTSGAREYVDVWLTRFVPTEQVLGDFAAAMPQSLRPVEARYVSKDLPSLSAACTIAEYEVHVGGEEIEPGQLTEALETVVGHGELVVERKGKTKVYDLARSLPKEPRVRSEGSEIVVELTTRMGQHGSLRPETLLKTALGRYSASGARMTVARLDTLIEEDGGVVRPL